jgi:hypothetical protein
MHKLLSSLAVVVLLAGQQGTLRTLSNEPGKWHPWSFQGGDPSPGELRRLGATAADVTAIRTRIKQVADILHATPVWVTPMGVDAHLSGSVSAPIVPGAQPYQPLAGSILFGSYEHFEIAQGAEPYEHTVAGETLLISIDFNHVPIFHSGGILLKDDRGEFAREPQRSPDLVGFQNYRDLIVIATNGRPLTVPVSRERFLKAFIAKRRGEAALADTYIADQQKKLDEFKKPEAAAARQAKYAEKVAAVAAKSGAQAADHERKYWERDEADTLRDLTKGASRDPAVSRQAAIIAGLKAAEDQLAAASPDDRQKQACYVDSAADPSKSGLTPMGTPGCGPLISQNLEYFDPKLPRSVIQIITASQFGEAEKIWHKGRPAAGSTSGSLDMWTTWEAFRTADWKTIVDMIGK